MLNWYIAAVGVPLEQVASRIIRILWKGPEKCLEMHPFHFQ